MRCPSCKKEFHIQPDAKKYYWAVGEDEDSKAAFGVAVQLCPSCHELVVIYREGLGMEIRGEIFIEDLDIKEFVAYPETSSRSVPKEVPPAFKSDFLEACSALEFSAKASAALSRRLLQKVLREALNIRKRDLSKEIDEFIEKSNAPAYLTGAIDAIRNIGNFASHPLKYTNTGEIVDVEEGEADWLIEVLESLFDFVFVQPAKLEQRRNELNKKLRDLGKPELKGK